jgi:hypothetical protein
LNLAPSTGAGNLDTLISLYIAWGKEFVVLLDSDKEGRDQKKRYVERFGALMETRVFTLEDVNSEWSKVGMEKLFCSDETLLFIQTSYPDADSFNKTHFNRTIQEHLINGNVYSFASETVENMRSIITFLQAKLDENQKV